MIKTHITKTAWLPVVVLMVGISLWITVAIINNLDDLRTNAGLIMHMITMEPLVESPAGEGLMWRALPEWFALPVLIGVVLIQVIICGFLWRAAVHVARIPRQETPDIEGARGAANQALAYLMGLWFLFLIGGLWFGYWIEQGEVQNVHLLLLITTMVALVTVNTLLEPSRLGLDSAALGD